MQSDLCHLSSLFTAIQCITLKVVYAAFEQVLNVKTGWADSSRRMWHFSEDAVPNLRNNITKRIISFRVVSNIFLYILRQSYLHFYGWGMKRRRGGGGALLRSLIRSADIGGWVVVMRIETQQQQFGWVMDGRTTPRSAVMDTFRWDAGGTSL